MIRSKISKRRVAAKIVILVLLVLSAVFYMTARYKTEHFGDAQIDEIVFYLTNGAVEGQSTSLIEAAQDNILLTSIVLFLLLLPVVDFYRNRIVINLDLSFVGKKKKVQLNPSRIPLRYKLVYALIVFLLASWLLLSSFGVFEYVQSLTQKSQLFEERYVDPKTAKLTFPEQKRNLIYIYMESMENTIASRAAGGQAERSIIPELEQLATDPNNVSFSNVPAGLGGALPVTGTTWTVGGMVAQTGGVPLKTAILGRDHNAMGIYKDFLPGAWTLNDILAREGYNQTFIMGSDASFGGRDNLLTQHGGVTIHDYKYAKQTGAIPPDYGVWWGYEDKKLFEFARNELARLSSSEAPFSLQLLTVDTHFTDGYLDPTCPTEHQKQYDNVFACSSQRVAEFITWVQEQPFADNTTIILTGDHLGMQTSYYDGIITDPNYQRTIYNAFINPALTPAQRQQRLFSSFDMYPSTLAAMGVHIEGDRLGLGVNLFSDQQTLLEQYGSVSALNDELSRYSEFYERSIFRRKE